MNTQAEGAELRSPASFWRIHYPVEAMSVETQQHEDSLGHYVWIQNNSGLMRVIHSLAGDCGLISPLVPLCM